MRFFRRTRRLARATGVAILRSAIEYNLGKTDRGIRELEDRKQIYQSIRTGLDQLFGHAPSQGDVIYDCMKNENMH